MKALTLFETHMQKAALERKSASLHVKDCASNDAPEAAS